MQHAREVPDIWPAWKSGLAPRPRVSFTCLKIAWDRIHVKWPEKARTKLGRFSLNQKTPYSHVPALSRVQVPHQITDRELEIQCQSSEVSYSCSVPFSEHQRTAGTTSIGEEYEVA